MRKKHFSCYCLIILTVLLIAGFMIAPEARAILKRGDTVYLNFGTGNPGGSWYIMAGGISAYFTRELKDVNVVTESAGGDVELASRICKGDLDITMTHSVTMAAAYRAIGIFKGKKPCKTVRVLAKMYDSPITIVTLPDAPINSIMDLKGKSLAGGPQGSGSVKNLIQILEAFGLRDSVKIKYYTYADEATALIEGHIDAFLQNSAPVPNVMEVEAKKGVKIIPFTKEESKKFMSRHMGFWSGDIKPGVYHTIQKPIWTVWDTVFWIADQSVPDDVVYRMLKLIFTPEGKSLAAKIHKNLKEMGDGIYEDSESMGVPMHPGAVKYWQEQGKTIPAGLMPPK